VAVATNKTVVRRFMVEVLGHGHVALLPHLVAPSYVTHLPLGDQYGPEGARLEVADYRTAFPDLAVTLDELLADGDQVVRRFTLRGTHRRPLWGIPAMGQPVVLSGIGIDRLAGGRLVESWGQLDLYPLIRSLADPMAPLPGRDPGPTVAAATDRSPLGRSPAT